MKLKLSYVERGGQPSMAMLMSHLRWEVNVKSGREGKTKVTFKRPLDIGLMLVGWVINLAADSGIDVSETLLTVGKVKMKLRN